MIWNNCADSKRPENGERVLVVMDNDTIIFARYITNSRFDGFYKDSSDPQSWIDPTHWMHTPNPPEEGEK